MKAKKLFPDLSFKRLWDKIKELENGVSVQNPNSVVYNSETDCMDVYQNDLLVGSVHCYFQKKPIVTNGVENEVFSLSNGSNARTLQDGYIRLTRSTAGAWQTNNLIDLTPYNKLIYKVKTSASNITLYGGYSSVRGEWTTWEKTVTIGGSTVLSEYEIDISNLSGSYYIGYHSWWQENGSSMTMDIYDIYLVK